MVDRGREEQNSLVWSIYVKKTRHQTQEFFLKVLSIQSSVLSDKLGKHIVLCYHLSIGLFVGVGDIDSVI